MKNLKIKFKLKKLNNKGSALMMASVFTAVLLVLSASFALFTVNELNHARRYRDSTAAFWLAESGVNEFIHNTFMLDGDGFLTINYGKDSVYLVKNDSDISKRVVTVTGKVGEIERKIQLEFPATSPEVFNNTLSIKGNLEIVGKKTSLAFNDKTRIDGVMTNTSDYSSLYVEDKGEHVNPSLVTMTYPDTNKNGVPDEFTDFVQFNRELLGNYSKNEVIYLKGNDNYILTPSESMKGKKILYVEGTEEGKGNITIQFGGALEDNQNLTVISTGTVTYNQPASTGANSKLNVIAWSGYTETAALPSTRTGTTYTHGTANFDQIYDNSTTYGNLVANDGMTVREVWSNKTFNYADTRTNGIVPPGFEGLVGGGSSGYSSKPISWREI